MCYINSLIKGFSMCYLHNKWYQSPWWWCVARWQGYEKVPFADGMETCDPFRSWSRDGSVCTWSPHKCTSYKASPIKPIQRSWNFADGVETCDPFHSWSRDGGACTWSPHKCTLYKASPIKPIQRSWKKTHM